MTTMLGVSLSGRDVLLVGGGAVTARRLQRFLDDGALPRVVAPDLSPAVRDLVEAHGVPWAPRRFRREDLDGAWLVHTATGDLQVDLRVAALCEAQRVLCVNASDGAHGTARIAADTRSGDVVVGVMSDAGVDPGRAARLRDAIERLLVSGRLPLRRRRGGAAGRVDLVGGGPGPVDLMTVRARRLLAEADVVVADRLGPADALLPELDPDVLVIDVGKRPGHHPVPQDEINRLLVAHAQAGRRVVRLKGGDPFVFGRGGEELAACLAAGVPVEVVPGPTSAVSVPQAAGIPVTHRGTAASVHIVNGQGEIADTTLAALSDAAVTTVFLMGVAALPRIVAAALAHGVPEDRPVAIVESGHTPQQRTTRTTLAAAVADARAAGVRNPAVIVIGDVARASLLLPEPELAGDTTT
ncbi:MULTISPECIES: uroporphyrinogen-III C-methyltransferase [Microbacterium]|uniref:Uroporphyrinogen-III C-methyltransferase n=1 Tax=Microbacterium barkeri TaxID=33917 RepID=A0A9W6LVB1_9MICO|nr:uroporphyrinogen-III C-methyltransferase [Microbacterium barkeri]MDI6942004.1 uroporphyrinogen-III C-methyltransferase [Microbacterium barkeri]MDR6875877.1 uroporphyrin-III C-methyltransferase/precorrin-2 dehydrogenase/sirohydrochlorin ferrochelatase [Microbacterium barkeri]GLJ59995.1 uroporphyrinogen-III C-methyltransferase [Microbacterium barkeri]